MSNQIESSDTNAMILERKKAVNDDNSVIIIKGKKKGKKTMGRRKIEIKKIEKKSYLSATFSKRRGGLFRKASELSILCGADVAILLQSPAHKMFAFGHPSLIDRLTSSPPPPRMITQRHGDHGRSKYETAAEVLEMEKRMSTVGKGVWWEEAIEGLELHQLEEFLGGLERLIEDVNERVEVQGLLEAILRSEEEEFDMSAPPPLQHLFAGDYSSPVTNF